MPSCSEQSRESPDFPIRLKMQKKVYVSILTILSENVLYKYSRGNLIITTYFIIIIFIISICLFIYLFILFIYLFIYLC